MGDGSRGFALFVLGVTEDDGSPADDGPACEAVGTVGGLFWRVYRVYLRCANRVAVDDVSGVVSAGLAVDKIGEKGCASCRNGLARRRWVPQVDDEKRYMSF